MDHGITQIVCVGGSLQIRGDGDAQNSHLLFNYFYLLVIKDKLWHTVNGGTRVKYHHLYGLRIGPSEVHA